MKPIIDIPDMKNKEAFQILKKAIDRYNQNKPFVLGITGAGGAGKTTFGNNIMNYYGNKNCVSIDLDDYFISREERGKLGLTGYNPRANKLFEARKNITDLCSGKKISKPRYNHSTGKLRSNETVYPKSLIVIEGVTTLYDELRELNHISFFLDAFEKTQIKSRIERDVNKRGYTPEEAMTLFKSVKQDYDKFIKPTKKYSLVVFEVDTDYVMHAIHIDKKLA